MPKVKDFEQLMLRLAELSERRLVDDFPLSRKALGAYFGSASNVDRVLKRGDLPYYQMTQGRVIVMNSDLRNYMDERKVDNLLPSNDCETVTISKEEYQRLLKKAA